MFTITTSLTESDIHKAVKLAKANYVELIEKHLRPGGGPTGSMCQTTVEVEVRAYLSEVNNGKFGLKVTPVLAKDEQNNLIGFAIALEGRVDTDCGLNYAVVHKDYRRQGVLRAMIQEIQSRYKFIGLSCKIDKVPYYEALGFRITGPQNAQVTLSWGLDKPHADMMILGFDHTNEVQNAKAQFMRLNGAKAQGILRKMDEAQKGQAQKVLAYLEKRGLGATHTEAV
jgi:GNAT superfamily N-acetyltransferase